jgi:hypothetical protein
MLTAEQILGHNGIPVPLEVLDQTINTPNWKQCQSCWNILPHSAFRRDSSYREGVRNQCAQCEMAPKLSTAEHIHRLKELNYNLEGTKIQRWENQEDYMNVAARLSGKWMHHSEFLNKLRKLVSLSGDRLLYLMDGRFVFDIALWVAYGRPQADGKDYSYMGYIPMGPLPEYSIYVFNSRDVPVKEQIRGWRTPLMRFILKGLITEEDCNKAFGEAQGPASIVWRRDLYNLRSRLIKGPNSTVVTGL